MVPERSMHCAVRGHEYKRGHGSREPWVPPAATVRGDDHACDHAVTSCIAAGSTATGSRRSGPPGGEEATVQPVRSNPFGPTRSVRLVRSNSFGPTRSEGGRRVYRQSLGQTQRQPSIGLF